MAKRRSLNRRWSRRSANNSAFLNDDTHIVAEDSNFWQYLNETNSRPPSVLNMTEATAVLDPDPNLIDSNASTSIFNYLENSTEELRLRTPKDPKEPQKPKEPDDKNQEASSPTDSDEPARLKKRRVVLGKSRPKNRGKNVFSMDSSSSTVDGEPPPPSSKKSPEKSQSKAAVTSPNSDTSVESDKMVKKRPKFKRPPSKLIGRSLLASGDDSIVAPSQETRRTSIKPRKTFLTQAPGEITPDNITQEESESEAEELISQRRKIFKRARRSTKSVNPFTNILEEIGDANTSGEAVKEKATENDSNDFVLHVDSVNSEEQKSSDKSKKRKISDVSGSSISEELKVGENSFGRREELIERLKSPASQKVADEAGEDDSDDYQSLEEGETGGVGPIDVPGGERDDRNLSVDGGRLSELKNSRRIVSPRVAEIKTGGQVLPDVSDDSDDAELFNSKRNKSLLTSKPPEHHQSPIISGSMVEASQESQDSAESGNSSTNNKRVTRSSGVASKTLNYSEVQNEETSSDTEEEAIIVKPSKLRSPKNPGDSTSEQELDVDTISEDEAIFEKLSESKSVDNNEKTPGKSIKEKAPVTKEVEEALNVSRGDPKSSKNLRKSEIPSKPQTPAPQLDQSHDSTREGDSALHASSRPGPRSSKTVKSPVNQVRESPEAAQDELIQRPGSKTKFVDKNEKTLGKLMNEKAPVAEEVEEALDVSRAGPRSSKILRKSEIPSKPQTPAPQIDESHDLTGERDSALWESSRPGPRSSKTVKSPVNQVPGAPEVAQNELIERPGPKSLKKSLLKSRNSENPPTSTIAREIPKTVQNDTESLSESSSRRSVTRRRDPSLYELPPKQRSPSLSISESDHEPSVSKRPKKPRTPQDPKKTGKSRKNAFDSDDEEQPPVETVVASPRRSRAPERQHLVPHVKILMGNDAETPPIIPVVNDNQKSRREVNERMPGKENVSMNDSRPSTSFGVPVSIGDPGAAKVGARSAGGQRKLRQLKLDAMEARKSNASRRLASDSDEFFDKEEFDKKIREIRSKELMKRAKNAEAEKAASKRKLEEMKRTEEEKKKRALEKLKVAFKRIDEEYRPVKKKPKTVDPAYIVNGKVYKRPKLPRPKHWATNKLYNYLWKMMEPKFGVETRVRSEKFVLDLAEAVTVIMRRKKYENYKGELEALLKKMAKLGIIKNRFDFNGFCYDFLPYEFRIKVISMLQFGNTHNIPFEPHKLMVPILGEDDGDS